MQLRIFIYSCTSGHPGSWHYIYIHAYCSPSLSPTLFSPIDIVSLILYHFYHFYYTYNLFILLSHILLSQHSSNYPIFPSRLPNIWLFRIPHLGPQTSLDASLTWIPHSKSLYNCLSIVHPTWPLFVQCLSHMTIVHPMFVPKHGHSRWCSEVAVIYVCVIVSMQGQTYT